MHRLSGLSMAQSCDLANSWVRENYEIHEDGVVAKSVIYKHYEDHCRHQDRPIMETSIFGRVVKAVFPDVNIRRLGGRDNLKYYYCGIQAKLTSQYAGDNVNTIRPKRKQRKRESITDKTEAQNCLRWLHSNYVQETIGNISKTEIYDHYVRDSTTWTNDPLRQGQFTLVIENAFPKVTKKKFGNKTSSQNHFVGISPRNVPVDPSSIPTDVISMFESLSANNKPNQYNEDTIPEEEEEYNCQSPESEGSDMSAGNSEHSGNDTKFETLQTPYYYYEDVTIKDEPVDYSISTLKLKDDSPISEMHDPVKDERMNDQSMSICRNGTPERPPSHMMMDDIGKSPSPQQKSVRNKIYKPRFHVDYNDPRWDNAGSLKLEQDQSTLMEDSHNWEQITTDWITECLQKEDGVLVNREQIYQLYEKYCNITNCECLRIERFDYLVTLAFPKITIIYQNYKTFYVGVGVIRNSDLHGKVHVYRQEEIEETGEVSQNWNSFQKDPLEVNSPPGHSSSPIILGDEDDEIDEGYDRFNDQPEDDMNSCYRENQDDDLNSIPEVLRDGKYYLRNWLLENFESVPEACVLKADAYKHYEIYAKSVQQTPFEMNVFGKVVRRVFPNVSIRRLGGRVKPQYHYCGISAKPTSALYALMSGKDPAQRSRKKEIATDSHTAEVAIEWLKRIYEPGKEKIIAKSEVYENYVRYCTVNGENPTSVNYFGKLVKHCFPNIEVRKFGGRTDPNWYYYGLNIQSHVEHEDTPVNTVQESNVIYTQTSHQFNHHANSSLPPQHPQQHHQHHPHHHMTTSNPIEVPGAASHLPISGSPAYSNSPQLLINQNFIRRQQLNDTTYLITSATSEPRSAITPEPYTRSPVGIDHRMMVRSPYEPDPAPDIYPRSPEDSAQTCRTTPIPQPEGPTFSMIYVGHGSLSSSPTSKRGAQVVPSQTPPFHVYPSEQAHIFSNKRIKHQVDTQEYSNSYSGRS